MGTEQRQLHIVFIPLMAPGHTIPMIDIVKLFSLRGVKTTILTTHGNAPLVQGAISRAAVSGLHLQLSLVSFPFAEAGFPEGTENLANCTTLEERMRFLSSLGVLRQPFEMVLNELSPDAIVSDMFFPWTVEISAQLGIPRIVFGGTYIFSQCTNDSLFRHNLNQTSLDSAESSVVFPGLPHRIEMPKDQAIFLHRLQPEFRTVLFYELEPDYVKYNKEVMGMKAWHVGPVSLCDMDVVDKSMRGATATTATTERHQCIEWLESKEQKSVLYICFGSLHTSTSAQLREIALGLEASSHNFLWVVKNAGDVAEWLPEGVEKMIKEGKGLIVTGWVPQVLILNHSAIGGFMTHCGWNSCLEAICAGQPMITWPFLADQFVNAKFVVDVLKVGVEIVSKKFLLTEEDKAEVVKADEIRRAVDRVMDGRDEGEGRRRRAREIGDMARRAVEEGGSSFNNMGNLIEELMALATGAN